MLVLSEPEIKLGFKWTTLDDMTDEECKTAISSIIQKIEGYANTGLNYIQDKFNDNKDEFRAPMVFVNLLRDIEIMYTDVSRIIIDLDLIIVESIRVELYSSKEGYMTSFAEKKVASYTISNTEKNIMTAINSKAKYIPKLAYM